MKNNGKWSGKMIRESSAGLVDLVARQWKQFVKRFRTLGFTQ
jgi:hypothetical protein